MSGQQWEVSLRCIGTGDAFGSGGRLSSCYQLAWGRETLLLDCGCSSICGFQRGHLDLGAIPAVVVSHLHGDHFGGIPYMILAGQYLSHRTTPLILAGPSGLQRQVEAALEALYPGTLADGLNFAVNYLELQADSALMVGGFQIVPLRVKHGRNPEAFALRVTAGEKIISYTGDTEWTESLIPLAANSDLLISECFAYDVPIPSHLDYQTLLRQRERLKTRRLVLTHLGPEVLKHLEELELETLKDGDLLTF